MGNTPTLYLAVDKTGSSSSNLQTLEPHSLPLRSKRVIKPTFSPFFANSVRVFGITAGGLFTTCTRGVHYVCTDLYTQLTQEYGQEVCGAIAIFPAALNENFKITYQAVGGEDSVDALALAQAVKGLAASGIAVEYDDITDKPKRFTPGAHLHDIEDLYGMEYLTAAIRRLLPAIESSAYHNSLNLRNLLRQSKRSIKATLKAGQAVAVAHVMNRENPHRLTAFDVHLDLVENRGFVPFVKNDLVIEPYISAQDVALKVDAYYALLVQSYPPGTPNPTGVTKAQLLLSHVQNYDLLTDYLARGEAQEGSYYTQYVDAVVSAYVSAYSAVRYIAEYGQEIKNVGWFTPIDAVTNPDTGELVRTRDLIDQAAAQVQATALPLAQTQALQPQLTDSQAHTAALLREQTLLHANAPASAMMRQLLTYHGTKQKLYNVPPKLSGLHCWVDFSDSSKLVAGVDGSAKVVLSINDKSNFARRYTAASVGTAPRLGVNEDVLSGIGLIGGTVGKFSSGLYHLDQTLGAPVVLRPGMTIITVARPGNTGSSLSVLSQTNQIGASDLGGCIMLHGANRQAMRVKASKTLTLMEAPANTSVSNVCSITVASISADSTQDCWLATSYAADETLFPYGHNGLLPERTPAEIAKVGVPLQRIGFNNLMLSQQGEIGEFFIYDHLSAHEVRTLVDYIRMKWSDTVALPMDLTFVQYAFQAPVASV